MPFTISSPTEGCRPVAGFRLLALIGLPAILVGIQAQGAEAPFRELVARVPSGANAIVLLNVEKALDSPLAAKLGWKENVEKAFAAGLSRVPPQATRFVLASQIDLEFMEPIWEAAVVEVNEAPTMAQIAEKRVGVLDTVENLAAVALANDTYVVQFGPNTLGAMAPANRQSVLRWVRETADRSGSALSSYLQRAAGFSDDAGTEIIMAFDLEGAFYEAEVREYLKSQELLADSSNVERGKLAKLLVGVEGFRLGIRIGERPFGKVVVDFTDDVAIAAPLAKSLLLEILADAGAHIHDLTEWTSTVEGDTVSLEGYFSPEGLRRVMSVVDSPAPSEAAPEQDPKTTSPSDPVTTSPSDPVASKAQASLEHFQAVTGMFRGLKSDMRTLKTLASSQLFYDKYAKRIERLPILNVDEELLDYSAFVAQSLRNASGAVRTMGIRGGVRQSGIISGDGTVGYVYGGGTRYGRYGGYGGYGGYARYSPRTEARSIDSQRRVVRSQERGAMATDVHAIRDQVIAATTDMRRKMTQKYQIEF